jgi:hypothetical protein
MPFAKVFALLGGQVGVLCKACRMTTTLERGAALVCALCGTLVTPAPGYPLVTEVQPQEHEAQPEKEELRHDAKRKRRRRKPVMPVVR